MKLKVLKGYVSNDCRLYGKGMTFETDDASAKYLISEGAAAATEGNAAASPAPEPEKEKAEEKSAANEEEMTLPDADPAAAVKTSGKK